MGQMADAGEKVWWKLRHRALEWWLLELIRPIACQEEMDIRAVVPDEVHGPDEETNSLTLIEPTHVTHNRPVAEAEAPTDRGTVAMGENVWIDTDTDDVDFTGAGRAADKLLFVGGEDEDAVSRVEKTGGNRRARPLMFGMKERNGSKREAQGDPRQDDGVGGSRNAEVYYGGDVWLQSHEVEKDGRKPGILIQHQRSAVGAEHSVKETIAARQPREGADNLQGPGGQPEDTSTTRGFGVIDTLPPVGRPARSQDPDVVALSGQTLGDGSYQRLSPAGAWIVMREYVCDPHQCFVATAGAGWRPTRDSGVLVAITFTQRWRPSLAS